MRERDIDEIYIRAMKCHGYGICTDTKPESQMEKVLFTVDELTGLINAACLMRPSKSVLDLEVKSVKKKFKDKSFAAGVDRQTVRNGCEMLGMELDEVIRETIEGMKEKAGEIGPVTCVKVFWGSVLRLSRGGCSLKAEDGYYTGRTINHD